MTKHYSYLFRKIKIPMEWDEFPVPPIPPSKKPTIGYRINIELEEEEEIERAKKFLQERQIHFNDRKANSFSETVSPGDRTLRVEQMASVMKLRQMWVDEFEKSRLGQALKRQHERN